MESHTAYVRARLWRVFWSPCYAERPVSVGHRIICIADGKRLVDVQVQFCPRSAEWRTPLACIRFRTLREYRLATEALCAGDNTGLLRSSDL